MRIEPAVSVYRDVRAKKHGIGQGSHLCAMKSALAMFALVNGSLDATKV